MAFSPVSFLLGLGTAYVLPVVSRNFRPLAVEAAAMGMGLVEDLRRVVAEQLENLEDIAAEARARREQLIAGIDVETDVDGDEDTDAGTEPAPEAPPRRRGASRSRSRTN